MNDIENGQLAVKTMSIWTASEMLNITETLKGQVVLNINPVQLNVNIIALT